MVAAHYGWLLRPKRWKCLWCRSRKSGTQILGEATEDSVLVAEAHNKLKHPWGEPLAPMAEQGTMTGYEIFPRMSIKFVLISTRPPRIPHLEPKTPDPYELRFHLPMHSSWSAIPALTEDIELKVQCSGVLSPLRSWYRSSGAQSAWPSSSGQVPSSAFPSRNDSPDDLNILEKVDTRFWLTPATRSERWFKFRAPPKSNPFPQI